MIPDYNSFFLRITAFFINLLGSILFFWIFPKKIEKERIKKILIIKFDRIGDSFLATPAIEGIRLALPDATIILLAAPWNRAVFEGNPNIDVLETYVEAPDVQKSGIFDFLSRTRTSHLTAVVSKLNPDMGIDLQGNPLNVAALFFARTPFRVGFSRKLLSFLLNKRIFYKNGIHQSDVYFEIPRQLGFAGEKPEAKIFVNREIEEKIRKIIKNNNLQNFIVFHLGSGRSYRQWPLSHFLSLAKKLFTKNSSLKIAVIGSADDTPLVNQFLDAMSTGVVNLVGTLGVRELYCLLRFARGFVGNESAPAHLAGSIGIPTIMLMNEWSGIERWQAQGEKVYLFKGEKKHRCAGVRCKELPCPNMASISVEDVFRAAKDF